jgi:hypothetical protein
VAHTVAWEVEIRKVAVQDQQKVSKTSFSTNKPGMVVCNCHPIGRRIAVREPPRAKIQDPIGKITKAQKRGGRGRRHCANDTASTCLTSMRH